MFLVFLVGVLFGIPILLAAMVITSQLGGGVDFGDIRWVLLKALPLLVIVNALSLNGAGRFLAIIIWWIGLKLIFGLDFWEVRMLVFVNWALNFALHYALLAMLL